MKKDDFIDAIGKIDAKYVTEAEQPFPKKRSQIQVWVSAAACVMILIAGGYTISQNVGITDKSETTSNAWDGENNEEFAVDEETNEELASGAEADNSDEAMDLYANITEMPNVIVFNQLMIDTTTGETTTESGALAGTSVWKAQTLEELETYYGVRLIPDTLPTDLKLQSKDTSYRIYYKDESEKELLSDENVLIFSNEDFSRKLSMTVATVMNDRDGDFSQNTDYMTSVINGTNLILVQVVSAEKTEYVAQYHSGNAYVEVVGQNLLEEEFIEIVSSLLQ